MRVCTTLKVCKNSMGSQCSPESVLVGDPVAAVVGELRDPEELVVFGHGVGYGVVKVSVRDVVDVVLMQQGRAHNLVKLNTRVREAE